MCAEIIEAFQKCHVDHPVKKFFGECTDLKIKLDQCFRQEVLNSFSLFPALEFILTFICLFLCENL